MNLFESYKGRLAISEKYYAQKNNGAKMSNNKKLVTAQCLDNVAKFMNESFKVAAGTQRADLGMYKTFCMDITAITMPNLIVEDIFLVKPMQSFTGYLTYMQYALGEEKGGAGGKVEDAPYASAMAKYGDMNDWQAHDIINSPFTGLGKMTEERMAYTGEKVVETLGADKQLSWTPVKSAEKKVVDSEGKASWEVVDVTPDGVVDAAEGDVIRYIYDNVYIPQEKLPSIVGRMSGIALTAKARKLAIEYDLLGAFQAKTDYGFDLESTLAQQAQAELEYQIDSEAVYLVKEAGDMVAAQGRKVEWTDEELDTISYSMKAEGFARKLEQAKMLVYKATNRFLPNWMLVSPDMMPILNFVKGFTPANNAIANGPYIAGDVAGMKVIVSPILENKVCYLGVLGNDGKTGVGVFAPYMPIVNSGLIKFADFRASEGFASMYDMKVINPLLLAKIEVKDGNDAALYEEI